MLGTLGVSLILHVIFVASVVRFPVARASSLQTPERGSIEIRPLTVRTPVPTPPPTPSPSRVTSPPAPATIPPRVATSPRRPHHVRFRPHLVQVARGPSPRNAAPPGRADGTPGGDPTGAPGPSEGVGARPASAAPSATPMPTPSPTAKPSCTTPDLPARAIDVVSPTMPDTAEERQETGTVRVLVALGTSGAVGATSIETSSGFPDLDQAALRAAQQSRFVAEIHDCRATAGTYLFVARFEE